MATPRTKASRKYNDKTYDNMSFKFPKGTNDKWKEEALKRNMSLSQFIQTAVNLYIKNCPAEELPSITNKTIQKENEL